MSARAPMERTTARRSPSGLLLVDKPAGPSSFAVVRRLKGRYRAKAGHAGTLDPLASGLLLVLLGPSTRLARYLVGLDKRYVAEIELGVRTATGDAEGEALERAEPPSRGDLEAALARLVGEVELPVPAASAVKVGGERAYRLHRRGEEVEMPVRHSLVHEIVLRRYEPPVAELGLHVGSGTYVRALADVLGGHCRSLRRTAVGPFCVEDADEDVLIPPADALPFLPDLPLEPAEVGRVLSGQSIPRPGEGRARLTFEGRLIAVARLSGGVARPETVLSRGNRP
jgi:tRNA pseudouridine55 synthase